MKGKILKAIAASLAAMLIVSTPVMAMTANGVVLDMKSLYSDNSQAAAARSDGGAKGETTSPTSTPPTTTPPTTTPPTTSPTVTPDFGTVIGIALSTQDIKLEAGDSKHVKANVLIKGGDADKTYAYSEEKYGKITWSVSNGTASVSNMSGETNTVNALAGGKAVLTAKLGEYSAVADISVKEYATKLELPKTMENHMYVKKKVDMNNVLIRTAATSNDTIKWASSSSAYASVDKNGVVTLKKVNEKKVAGVMQPVKVTISAVSERGVKAECDLTIKAGAPAAMMQIYEDTVSANRVLAKESLEIPARTVISPKVLAYTKEENDKYKQDKVAKAYTSKNKDTCTDDIVWTSNKPSVVKVMSMSDDRQATLSAVGVGTATVTAKATSGKSVKYTITVTAPLTAVDVRDKSGNESGTVTVGMQQQLNAVKSPAANALKAKWSVDRDHASFASIKVDSKTGVATVTTKYVKPKTGSKPNPGSSVDQELTITASYTEGKGKDAKVISDTYKLKVTPTKIDAVKTKDAFAEVKLFAGESIAYSADLLDAEGSVIENAQNCITWKSSNAKVASIDANGNLTAVGAGTANVTATVINASGKSVNNSTKGTGKNASKGNVAMKVVVTAKTTGLVLSKDSVYVYTAAKQNVTANTSVTLKATKTPKTSKDVIKWSVDTSDMTKEAAALVSVNEKTGRVSIAKGVPAGQSFKIIAAAVDAVSGKAAVSTSATVTVINKSTKVVPYSNDITGGESSKAYAKSELGKSFNLKARVYATVANDAAVETNVEPIASYTYSKANVFVASNGEVYGLKAGKTIITVKTVSGKSGKFYVEFTAPAVNPPTPSVTPSATPAVAPAVIPAVTLTVTDK